MKTMIAFYDAGTKRLLAESNAHFKRGHDAYVARCIAKEEAAISEGKKPKRFIIATCLETVEFQIDGVNVVVKRQSRTEGFRFENLSLDHARAEYQRLLKAGYHPW
jgi:hypothetical protein